MIVSMPVISGVVAVPSLAVRVKESEVPEPPLMVSPAAMSSDIAATAIAPVVPEASTLSETVASLRLTVRVLVKPEPRVTVLVPSPVNVISLIPAVCACAPSVSAVKSISVAAVSFSTPETLVKAASRSVESAEILMTSAVPSPAAMVSLDKRTPSAEM